MIEKLILALLSVGVVIAIVNGHVDTALLMAVMGIWTELHVMNAKEEARAEHKEERPHLYVR